MRVSLMFSIFGGRICRNFSSGRFYNTDLSSLRNDIAAVLSSLPPKPGRSIVQSCGESDTGKLIIELARKYKLQTISIIEDKPGVSEIIEELKGLGGDIVVPESYTKTWYMKRLSDEMRPSAGFSLGDGYQLTAVAKAVAGGGKLVFLGKELPKYITYGGDIRKAIEWDMFLRQKKLQLLTI